MSPASQAKFYCLMIGLQLMLLEILTMRGLSTAFASGPIFLIVPLALCGGAIGSTVIAKWPALARPILSFSPEFLVTGSLISLTSIVFLPSFATEYFMAWPVLVLCAFATVIWGALLTVQFLAIGRPANAMFYATAGSCLAVAVIPIWSYCTPRALQAGLIVIGLIPVLMPFASLNRIALRVGLVSGLAILLFLNQSGMGNVPRASIEKSYANSFSTIEVAKTSFSIHPNFSGDEFSLASEPGNLNLYAIYRNSRRATFILDAERLEDLQFLREERPFTLMNLGAKNSIAIIGSGGGEEILQARLAGYKEITAVEINPLMISAVRDFSRNFALSYGASEVETVVQDARFYFRHLASGKKFNTIVIKNVKNYGSPGIEFFDENYALTNRGFHEYAEHLAPDGLLIVKLDGDRDLIHVLSGSMRDGVSDEDGELFVTHLKTPRPLRDNILERNDGMLAVFHNGREFSSFNRRALWAAFNSTNHAHSVMPSASLVTRDQLSSDDRPYPMWLSAVHPEIWIWPALLVLSLASMMNSRRLGAQSQARNILMCGFLSGVSFSSVEVLFSEQAVFVSGDPTWAPMGVILACLVAGLFVYRMANRGPQNTYPRNSLVALPLAVASGWTLLLWIQNSPLSSLQFLVLATAMVAWIAVLSARVYLYLINEIQAGYPAWLPGFLSTNGFGLLVGGLGVKFVSVDIGKSAGLMMIVATNIAYLVICHFGVARSKTRLKVSRAALTTVTFQSSSPG